MPVLLLDGDVSFLPSGGPLDGDLGQKDRCQSVGLVLSTKERIKPCRSRARLLAKAPQVHVRKARWFPAVRIGMRTAGMGRFAATRADISVRLFRSDLASALKGTGRSVDSIRVRPGLA